MYSAQGVGSTLECELLCLDAGESSSAGCQGVNVYRSASRTGHYVCELSRAVSDANSANMVEGEATLMFSKKKSSATTQTTDPSAQTTSSHVQSSTTTEDWNPTTTQTTTQATIQTTTQTTTMTTTQTTTQTPTTTTGASTYNCVGNDPCPGSATRYFPHADSTRYVECASSMCFDRQCAAGTFWNPMSPPCT